MKALLEKLNIDEINQGACTGPDGWIHTEGPVLTSCNPATGEVIAGVRQATPDAYHTVVDSAGIAFSLEMGKIRVEGMGEVQEMIDICDFAVGLSRQLYGLTMASERPLHRMYEQWHPLGPIGIITAFNFPVAVWSWNAAIAAVCGDTMVWKPSGQTPLTAIATQQQGIEFGEG